jgi:NAD-dependent aldehyde dehydrogenases
VALDQGIGARRGPAEAGGYSGRALAAISELIAREMGKPIRVNMAREVEGAVDKLRYFAGAARFLEGHVTGSTAPELWDMVLPEPAGVAALSFPGTIRWIWRCASWAPRWRRAARRWSNPPR